MSKKIIRVRRDRLHASLVLAVRDSLIWKLAEGEMAPSDIADIFGLNKSTVSRILHAERVVLGGRYKEFIKKIK